VKFPNGSVHGYFSFFFRRSLNRLAFTS
jgi:hypothetical protein